MRSFLLLGFLLISPVLFSQGASDKNSFWPYDINVILEYFAPTADPVFVKKNRLAEVVLFETLIEADTIVYEKPVLINRYQPNGIRTHAETNNWHANGGASRYMDFYKDSSIYVTDESNKWGSVKMHHNLTVLKTYLINDTLSRTIEYVFYDDSLYTKRDKGIFDSKADGREMRAAYRKNSKPVKANLAVVEDLAGPDAFPTLGEEAGRVIEKDAQGRIVKITRDKIVFENENYTIKPGDVIFIKYYNDTPLLRSVEKYFIDGTRFYDAPETITSAEPGMQPEGLAYRLLASDFRFGIPATVTITTGKNGANKRIYRATIRTY